VSAARHASRRRGGSLWCEQTGGFKNFDVLTDLQVKLSDGKELSTILSLGPCVCLPKGCFSAILLVCDQK
jgi:hypothetical protein